LGGKLYATFKWSTLVNYALYSLPAPEADAARDADGTRDGVGPGIEPAHPTRKPRVGEGVVPRFVVRLRLFTLVV
jgi:hypothetical protein